MSNPLYTNKRVLLAKDETTPGTDAVPDTTNVILLDTLSVKKLKTNTVDRNTVKPFFGGSQKITASAEVELSVEFALSIGGDANGIPVPGATPAWDLLVQGCAMARTVSGSAVTGTAQDGNVTVIKLASDASATDDAYTGLSIYVTADSGAAQAPGSSAKNIIKLKAGASAVDDHYNGYFIKVTHFSGTIVSTSTNTSTIKNIYLPLGTVGANNLLGLDLKITTGAAQPETRRIIAYNIATGKATLASAIVTTPTNASTFVVSESKQIIGYVGSTKIATLKTGLRFVTIATTPYEIAESRLITDYNGTTKNATVTPALTRDPTANTTYIIGAYVKYYPVSNAQKSLTFYFYEDGAFHSFTYSKGTMTFDFSSGALPMAKATFTGLLETYDEASLPAVSTVNWVEPLPVNYQNTKNIFIHGFDDVVLEKISFDLGNKVVHRNMPGADRVLITGRDVKGQITLETVLKSTFDFYAVVQDSDINSVLFTHGPIGNQIGIFCPNVQLSNPNDSDKDGISMLSLDLNMPALGAGNNEINLILQ